MNNTNYEVSHHAVSAFLLISLKSKLNSQISF